MDTPTAEPFRVPPEVQKLIEERLGRHLTETEQSFVADAMGADLLADDVVSPEPPEPESSPEEQLLIDIREADDHEEQRIIPEERNPFGNLSAVVHRSASLGKEVVEVWRYHRVTRGGRLVGREGNVAELLVREFGESKPGEFAIIEDHEAEVVR